MIDKPVLLAATGGSDRHALILEHQFRPLFGFFQSITLPIGVYANDASFEDYVIQDGCASGSIRLSTAPHRSSDAEPR